MVLASNHPPVANAISITRYPTQSVKLSAAQVLVLGSVSDPDVGDTVSVQSVGAPLFGTATLVGGHVFYTPNPGWVYEDSFTYTVADNHGATASSTITVSIITDNAPTNNITEFTKVAAGPAEIDFADSPGLASGVQYMLALGDPVWMDIGTVTMNAFGAAYFTDNDLVRKAAAAGFCRFIYPVPVPPAVYVIERWRIGCGRVAIP